MTEPTAVRLADLGVEMKRCESRGVVFMKVTFMGARRDVRLTPHFDGDKTRSELLVWAGLLLQERLNKWTKENADKAAKISLDADRGKR
jgi:hypothetical protein